MKVLLVNGSPHQKGCTYTALSEVAEALHNEGIKTDIYWIGNKPIGGCIGCFQCAKKQKCVFEDKVNEFTALAAGYDGFIFGSPVYYSGMNGSLMCFMDRVFFSASAQDPHPFRFKPAAAVVSARRSGTTSALDQINKYFLHQQMPIATSLEYGTWEHVGRSQTGCGGSADYAVSRAKHGLASETEGGRSICGYTASRSGRDKNINQLYQIINWYP